MSFQRNAFQSNAFQLGNVAASVPAPPPAPTPDRQYYVESISPVKLKKRRVSKAKCFIFFDSMRMVGKLKTVDLKIVKDEIPEEVMIMAMFMDDIFN